MRWLLGGLVITLGLLQAQIWFGSASVPQIERLDRELAARFAEIVELRARNNALAAEVADLRGGNDAVEARARLDLSMIRDGETLYRIIR